MNELIRFGVSIPADLIESFDESISKKGYNNRSEAIRDMMRDYLVAERWNNGEDIVAGTVTIVYDHDTRELSNVLNTLQHEYHDSIICATHVHMDAHHCLEVIVVKGRGNEVKAIADRLISVKGVMHGKLVCTTAGEH